MDTFGTRLKKLRKEKKLTQNELAAILEITQTNVSDYERSQVFPSKKVLEKLVHRLQVDLNWILTGIPAKPNSFSKSDDHVFKKDLFLSATQLMLAALQQDPDPPSTLKASEIIYDFYIHAYLLDVAGKSGVTGEIAEIFLAMKRK